MMFQNFKFDGKFSGLILFLIVQLFTSSEAWFENCDHKVTLPTNGSMYINSPYYPDRYPPGSSCRYVIEAPLDYEINVQCNIEIDKPSSQCTSDYFYISVDGDVQLSGSEYFCGDGYLQRKSVFNKLTIAYTSSTQKNAGKFSCLLQASPQQCDCGWSQQTRIVNGVETSINEFPFMTGIINAASNTVFCGGTIITHWHVMTAAHCVTRFTPNQLKVVVGEHDLRTSAETPYTRIHNIISIKIHERYTGNDGEYYDIALLTTANVIEWSRGVGPACLPLLYSFSTFAGMKADVVGWGTTSFAGSTSPVLQKATVQIISNNQCRPSYPNLDASQMCTYSPPKDSCQQDSGGPVVVRLNRLFITALISYGVACGTNVPSVNTRVTQYLDWIQTNTRVRLCQRT